VTHATADEDGTNWRELVAVILLSVTTILTAWSGFQSSKWGGEMAIAFNQASSARISATRLEGDANRKQTIQVALFTQWVQAASVKDQALMDFLTARFPEPLKTAFTAWQATSPATNLDAPSSPFVMPEYQIPELAAAKAADRKADQKFQMALTFNRRGDNYTLLTVAFASVLFFAAISGRMKVRRDQWILLGVGLCIFVAAFLLLVLYPKLV
jgi:hypothetical protein